MSDAKTVRSIFPDAWVRKFPKPCYHVCRDCPVTGDFILGYGDTATEAWRMAYDSLCQVMEGFEDE